MSNSIVEALRMLQRERADSSPFSNHTEFLRWSDEVTPLLAFDPKIQTAFKHAVLSADVSFKSGSHIDATGSVGRALGLAKQALMTLDLSAAQHLTVNSEVASNPGAVELPTKLTMKWLYEHTPVSFYAWLFGLLCAAFMAGVAFSEAPLYVALRDNASTKHPGSANAQ